MNSKTFSEINTEFTLPKDSYLNSASQTLCPTVVLDTFVKYANNYDAHDEYELVRGKVQKLINCRKDTEVVFTHGNNHSLNLLAHGICKRWNINDCVIVPESEHHANLIVWQKLSAMYNFRFETVNVIKDGSLDLGHLHDILDGCEGKILYSMSHISNSIGFVQPVKEIFAKVKEYDGITVLDASLSISRVKIDVQDMDIDFLTFTSHKFFSPTSVGILYGKHKLLEKLESIIWGDANSDLVPWKLEVGKPNICGVMALGSAIDWFMSYDIEDITVHDKLMNANMQMMLNELEFVKVFHPGYYKGGLISFNVEGQYAVDVGDYLRKEGIIAKAGFLNARPIVEEKFVNGVVRVSWSHYNTKDDIELLRVALIKAYQ